MDDTTMSSSDKKSGSPPSASSRCCEVLILHTAEAQEWASYLQKILKSSRKFPKRSIVLHAVQGPDDDRPHDEGYDFESVQSSRCIVLLLTAAFLDLLNDPALWDSLERLLQPPHRVVALLCGVAERDVLPVGFDHWQSWRKLHADQEPADYISTILESIADSRRHSDGPATAERAKPRVPSPAALTPSPVVAEEETVETVSEPESVGKKGPVFTCLTEPESVGKKGPVFTCLTEPESVGKKGPVFTCLTVQPNRVPCGDPVTIFIILKNKLDPHSNVEVEFSSCESDAVTRRVPATLENEYTISVAAPDMPAGEVALTVHTDQASEVTAVSPVTYYTNIGQVNFYLQNATSPMEFLCQAFNITSNVTESLDDMLTDSLKSRMPATGLHLFGITQIKEATYQTDLELPTLLHFAARFGLKKLSTVLLQCPGALQAYSVTNKYGEYPNTLAQRSGFLDLRHFMDDFVETAAMVKTHLKDSNPEEEGEVYEKMVSMASEDVVKMHSSCSEGIYESMVLIDPERAEHIYMAMSGDGDNSEEAMLRKFFQDDKKKEDEPETPEEEEEEEEDPYQLNPEDIYDSVDGTNAALFQERLNRPPAPIPRPQSLERVDGPYISSVFSEIKPLEESFKVQLARRRSSSPAVSDPYGGLKTPGQRQRSSSPVSDPYGGVKTPGQRQRSSSPVSDPYGGVKTPGQRQRSSSPVSDPYGGLKTPGQRQRSSSPVHNLYGDVKTPGQRKRSSSPVYDPYGGVKTPGQRQLIALQERVKVGVITVEEAVQEFKAWQLDNERRNSSIRYQQENLKRLRDSIMRRHKDKGKGGKNVEYEITSPLPMNHQFTPLECGVYESSPRALVPPPSALPPLPSALPPLPAALPPLPAGASRPIQRGSWKTGSTSSTSSTESNRLSTHSTMSYSSGTEPEFEDALDSIAPPTRPPRPTSEVPPNIPPPRIPPRIPERVPEDALNERYIACPTRALPQRPPRRKPPSPPPIPHRR